MSKLQVSNPATSLSSDVPPSYSFTLPSGVIATLTPYYNEEKKTYRSYVFRTPDTFTDLNPYYQYLWTNGFRRNARLRDNGKPGWVVMMKDIQSGKAAEVIKKIVDKEISPRTEEEMTKEKNEAILRRQKKREDSHEHKTVTQTNSQVGLVFPRDRVVVYEVKIYSKDRKNLIETISGEKRT